MPFTSAGKAVKDLVLRIAGEKYHALALIALSWRETVGSLLAEYSTPVKFDREILFIKVTNPIWLQELILIKSQIIDRLSHKLRIPITDIIFIAGSHSGRKRHR